MTCFVFLKHPFWDSPFCLITDTFCVEWQQKPCICSDVNVSFAVKYLQWSPLFAKKIHRQTCLLVNFQTLLKTTILHKTYWWLPLKIYIINFLFQQYPYPNYLKDNFITIVQSVMALVFVLAFLYTAISVIKVHIYSFC